MSEINHISAVTSALVESITGNFPVFEIVEKYPKVSKFLNLPACFIEADGFGSIDLTSTLELDMAVRFNVRIVMAPEEPNSKENILLLSALVAQYITTMKRLNESCGRYEIVNIDEEHFKPELESLLAWTIEVNVNITDGVQPELVIAPQSVYFSLAPDIGFGNEEKYVKVEP